MNEECREVLDRLEIYLDGETQFDLEVAIQHHLQDCPPCLDRAEFERELRALVAAKCRDCAPPGLLARIRIRLTAVG
ncbi:MAG: mycothiol system anti-sigma-R factor [Actinomycetota bacterium]|jgi:mycothiol system anti-sigma-R factor|nr:mycothiol system anti-sigma-R factor [Actinomycetota bacterium]